MGKYPENPFDGNYFEWQIAIQKLAYPEFPNFIPQGEVIEIFEDSEMTELHLDESKQVELYSSSTVNSR